LQGKTGNIPLSFDDMTAVSCCCTKAGSRDTAWEENNNNGIFFMVNSQNIEIKLSKLKLALMFFGSILFVITGILFVNNPTKYVSFIMRSPSFIFIAGCCAILFFGITGFFLLRKILDTRPGLILSDKGVMENAMYVSIGFIPWQDIIKLEHTKIVNQMFISIIVRNPEEYIKKQRSFFKVSHRPTTSELIQNKILCKGFPVLWQQFFNFVNRMIIDSA
jgi:hypothetical protein